MRPIFSIVFGILICLGLLSACGKKPNVLQPPVPGQKVAQSPSADQQDVFTRDR